jgi:metal-responsive CopG/Arc/MetJ family transcriptional regulator
LSWPDFDALDRVAAERGVSRSTLVRMIVEQYLGQVSTESAQES